MSELWMPDDAQGHPIRLDSNGIYNAWEDIQKMMEWTKLNAWCYDKDLQTDFIYFNSVYWYWSHSDSRFIFLPASGPIVLIDLCAARCCDSELRLTVHRCALWPIVAVTLLFWWHLLFALPIVLLRYISQACWVLCSPRLDFFHCTVISTLVAANRLKIPTPSLPDPSQSYSLQRP